MTLTCGTRGAAAHSASVIGSLSGSAIAAARRCAMGPPVDVTSDDVRQAARPLAQRLGEVARARDERCRGRPDDPVLEGDDVDRPRGCRDIDGQYFQRCVVRDRPRNCGEEGTVGEKVRNHGHRRRHEVSLGYGQAAGGQPLCQDAIVARLRRLQDPRLGHEIGEIELPATARPPAPLARNDHQPVIEQGMNVEVGARQGVERKSTAAQDQIVFAIPQRSEIAGGRVGDNERGRGRQ